MDAEKLANSSFSIKPKGKKEKKKNMKYILGSTSCNRSVKVSDSVSPT
jgi:hypothetical protein